MYMGLLLLILLLYVDCVHCMSSALTLFESSMMLGDLLLSQPLNMLSLFDSAIQSVAQLVLESDDCQKEDMVR